MVVYLRKQLINDSPATKIEVFSFTLDSFCGGKEVKTNKEPEWWRRFDTEQDALNYLKENQLCPTAEQ